MISEEAAKVLTELRKRPTLEWEKSPTWEVFGAEAKNYREALASIRICTRRDLTI